MKAKNDCPRFVVLLSSKPEPLCIPAEGPVGCEPHRIEVDAYPIKDFFVAVHLGKRFFDDRRKAAHHHSFSRCHRRWIACWLIYKIQEHCVLRGDAIEVLHKDLSDNFADRNDRRIENSVLEKLLFRCAGCGRCYSNRLNECSLELFVLSECVGS